MALADVFLPRAWVEGLYAAGPDTLAGLTAEVAGIVDDPGVTESDIARCLNQGLLAVAGAARLPDLADVAALDLEPGQESLPLPADWQHGPTDDAFLLPAGRRVRVLSGLAALRQRFAGFRARGRVRFVAVAGGRLHCRPAPDGPCTLEVGYFRLPDRLVAGSDKPRCLPAHLTAPLLVSFACRELFERLEEGAGERKVQTVAYGRRFEAALAELLALCSPVQDAAVDVPDAFGFGEDWP